MKSYWDNQHKENNKKALTGSTLDQYCEFFRLTDEVFFKKYVLEIGVGLGVATQYLGLLTDNLDVLDISDIAIERVLNYISEGYTDARDLNNNKYDILLKKLS